MSITTKIFIVLNLVLALCVSIGVFAVYGKQIYWVEQTRMAIDDANLMFRTIGKDKGTLIKEAATNKEEATRAKNDLQIVQAKFDDVDKKYKELDAFRNDMEAAKASYTSKLETLSAQLSVVADRNGELQARLDAEITKNINALKEKDWHQSRAIETAAELVESENEMMQLAKNNAEMVRRITLLATQLEKYVTRYGVDPETSATTAGFVVNGKVLHVEPKLDLVILSVGEKDKVQKGMEFIISRGDNYITKVRVANVYDAMCSAKIVDGMTGKGQAVKVSDSASTLD